MCFSVKNSISCGNYITSLHSKSPNIWGNGVVICEVNKIEDTLHTIIN